MPGATDQLSSILHRIAAIGVTARQIKVYHAPEDALEFFVDCLKTCVLPRSMVVFLDHFQSFEVAASGGRLLQIVERADDIGLKMGPITSADVSAICTELLAVFAKGSQISVEFRKIGSGIEDTLDGATGDQILAASGFQFLRDFESDPLDVLIEGAQDVLLGVYSPAIDRRATYKGFKLPTELLGWIDAQFSALGAADDTLADDEIALYRPSSSSEIAIGFHQRKGQQTALIIDANSITDLAEFWASY